MNRREHRRSRNRLRVRLQPGTISSMTGDMSSGGAFIHSHRILKPGTAVRFEIELPAGTAEAEGVVRWAKRVPAHLSSLVRSGMGVEFTWVSEELRAYLDAGCPVFLQAI